MATDDDLTAEDYRALGEVRYRIQHFLHFSERAARDAGLAPQQHQLLLALKGFPTGTAVTIGDRAERLLLQHHSAVELVDRLARRGLVERRRRGAAAGVVAPPPRGVALGRPGADARPSIPPRHRRLAARAARRRRATSDGQHERGGV